MDETIKYILLHVQYFLVKKFKYYQRKLKMRL